LLLERLFYAWEGESIKGWDCKKSEINALDSNKAQQLRQIFFNALLCLIFSIASTFKSRRIAAFPCLFLSHSGNKEKARQNDWQAVFF